MPNRLADQTSPYLLQHADNPVDWYPWGPEALGRARAEDKPIFLSIGYSACHWCHVMERESFEDPGIAELINRDFVAIKVDREERPDLDDVYMAAVQAMTGGGGWPMTVFLTPELEPFFGGSYFPPEDRHGLPGLPRLLAAVAEAFRERRDDVRSQGSQLVAHVRNQLDVRPGTVDPQAQQLQAAAARLVAASDPVHGGFGGAPKFPAPMTLEFLLRVWHRGGDDHMRRAITFTLDRMAAGGLFDQLGGGFARYSTDTQWLVPHFEKMLYDNAQLAHCYLEAYRATGDHHYAAVAGSTLDFMIRELQTDDGGFASALDADSEGEEGRFYTWSHDEFTAALAVAGLDDAAQHVLADYWGVTADGNWEGRNVLHRPTHPDAPAHRAAQPDAALLARGRDALLAARERRVRPARDEKQLAAWNGMALRALATGFALTGEQRYLEAARGVAGFVRRRLLREDHRLWRTARDGTAHTPGFAEDYANLADGLVELYAAGGDADDLLDAIGLARRALEDFWDEDSGTLFDTSAEHDASFARPRSLIDNATPAANSVAADVLLRLALITGDADLDRRARRILRAVAPAIERQPSAFGRMLCSMDRALSDPVDAVVVGDQERADALELRRAVSRPYAPNLVIAPRDLAASDLGDFPLFDGKDARQGVATAFVCRGYACDEPTTDPERAAAQVAGLTVRLAGS